MTSIEYKGQKVITSELLAQAYETSSDRIAQNYRRNREKFEHVKHFFILAGDDLKEFKSDRAESTVVAPTASQLYLWTERGANRHCKILDTDKAWEQFDNLEETYFRVKSNMLASFSIPPSVSPGGIASLISVTRRVMCDQGSTPMEIAIMTQNIYKTYNMPLSDNFVKETPEQLTFFNNDQLTGGK